MTGNRLCETVALLLVGDGVVTLMAPSSHVRLWSDGPGWFRRVMRFFAKNPMLTRMLALGEIVGGLWLARRQYDDIEPMSSWHQ